jgi:hypothetical protein
LNLSSKLRPPGTKPDRFWKQRVEFSSKLRPLGTKPDRFLKPVRFIFNPDPFSSLIELS